MFGGEAASGLLAEGEPGDQAVAERGRGGFGAGYRELGEGEGSEQGGGFVQWCVERGCPLSARPFGSSGASSQAGRKNGSLRSSKTSLNGMLHITIS